MDALVRRSRRRRWILPAVVGLVLVATPGLWLLDHLRPRDEYFVRRRGTFGSVQVTPAKSPGGALVSETVRVTADTGLSVDLRVVRPEGPSRPLPLVLILGGHRTGRDAVDLAGDPGPLAVAALDYPYHGPEKLRGWRQILASVPAIQRGLLDTPPAVSLALDWLVDQPWVDRTKVEMMGVSLGVPFAAVAGALDRRFRRVWLIHGGAGYREWIELNLTRHVPNRWWRARSADLLYLLAYGPTFDSARWVPRIAPRATVVIGAIDDEGLPRAAVERLYAIAREPKELIWTQGLHIKPRRREVLQQLLEIVRSRVLPLPAAGREGNHGAGGTDRPEFLSQ